MHIDFEKLDKEHQPMSLIKNMVSPYGGFHKFCYKKYATEGIRDVRVIARTSGATRKECTAALYRTGAKKQRLYWSKEDVAKVVDLYNSGKILVSEIAKRFQRNPSSVETLLRREGVYDPQTHPKRVIKEESSVNVLSICPSCKSLLVNSKQVLCNWCYGRDHGLP
jgi:hypothetical protein